jgi:hypothetical protein
MRHSGFVTFRHCGAKIMLVTCCDSFTRRGCTWAIWLKAEAADVNGYCPKATMTRTIRRAAEMPAPWPAVVTEAVFPALRKVPCRHRARQGRTQARVTA